MKHSAAPLLALSLAACGQQPTLVSSGDDTSNAGTSAGQQFFRTGTFGTEGFWTDGVGLGRGVAAVNLTLRDALDLGLQIDGDGLAISEGHFDPALLDDPAVFQDLLASDAVVGLVARDADGDGVLDLAGGADTLGVSCALCHSIVDGSLYSDELTGGAIGTRIDGPAPRAIDLGDLFALGTNSAALYPYLPQSHETIGGFPISRTGAFVDADAPEAEVDALLRDDASFPRGAWDTVPDGIGAPVVLPSLYSIRHQSPYGVDGALASPLDAINAHVTLGLDPTTLLTVPGTQFLGRVGGGVGTEIVGEFAALLDSTVPLVPAGGYPYVDATVQGTWGTKSAPVGLRLDERTLERIATYLSVLAPSPAPLGVAAARDRGAALYAANCASCHGDPAGLTLLPRTSLADLQVQYVPTLLLARGFPYSDALNELQATHDDRLVLFDLVYSDIQVPRFGRFIDTPRLIGLHLRGPLLHDGSVEDVDTLLDPERGPGAIHPFYLEAAGDRADLGAYLLTR